MTGLMNGFRGRWIKRAAAVGAIFVTVPALFSAHAAVAAPSETIVMVRHGEKPVGGLGQLDCQGLNRALKLPGVLARFGAPAAIFAPNPAVRKIDSGTAYDYIRPLATIEPTAIALGMPVDLSFGVEDWEALGHRLETPAYRGGVVLVVWEHSNIVKLARMLVADAGGDAKMVPDWDHTDFDGMFVVRIAAGKVSFSRSQEGLDGLGNSCPK